MESLPPDTKRGPLSFPFPFAGKNRKFPTLPKCFSSVARSLHNTNIIIMIIITIRSKNDNNNNNNNYNDDNYDWSNIMVMFGEEDVRSKSR